MPGSNADSGTGVVLTGGTSSWSLQITNLDLSGMERAIIKLPHHGVTANTTGKVGNIPKVAGKLIDAGGVDLEGYVNTGLSGATKNPPVILVAETWTITLPKTSTDTTAASISGLGFFSSFSMAFPMDAPATFKGHFDWAGEVTLTAAV